MNTKIEQVQSALAEAQRTYLARVYGWMVGGLAITGVIAGWVTESIAYQEFLFMNSWFRIALFVTLLGIVIFLSARIQKISVAVASASFVIFSALMGLSLGSVLLRFTPESTAPVFFIAAATFGVTSLYGYVTKRDLASMGSFFFMGLIGLIIASIVNIFMQSSALYFAISIVGVLVFVGLTAYDTQKIKENWEVELMGTEIARKSSIMGALNLYLDFLNLFIFLLRLLGDRR